MPSKHYYHSTEESPLLLADEVFQNGITFNVKMIGSMDIPRPMSRIEIVAAMRRVRLEFKSKGIKKRKVVLSVGVSGAKTCLRIKKTKNHHLKYRSNSQSDEIVVLHHPIYRIFYVSHDSQDVKVFSYIARESSSNVFHCCVFKASKKRNTRLLLVSEDSWLLTSLRRRLTQDKYGIMPKKEEFCLKFINRFTATAQQISSYRQTVFLDIDGLEVLRLLSTMHTILYKQHNKSQQSQGQQYSGSKSQSQQQQQHSGSKAQQTQQQQHSSKSQHSQQQSHQQHSTRNNQQLLQQQPLNTKSQQLQQYASTKSHAQQAQQHQLQQHQQQQHQLQQHQQQQHQLQQHQLQQQQQQQHQEQQHQQQQQRKKISFENQFIQSNAPANSHPNLPSPNESNKQALRIVRTIGQAFEVCHKLNSPGGEEEGNERNADSPNGDIESQRAENASPALTPKSTVKKTLISTTMSSKQRPPPLKNTWAKQATDSPTDFSTHDHQLQLLNEQLEQEVLNTRAALGQLNLLREQLSTEMSARIEAENRNKQLLNHNKELLNHLQVLVQHIQELEGRPTDFGREGGTLGSTSGSPQNPSPSPQTRTALYPTSSLLLQSSLLEVLESQLHRFYSPSLVVGNQHLETGTPVHKSVKLPAELLKLPPATPPTKSSLISRSVSEKCHRELPQLERTSAWMRHTTK